MSTQDIPKIIVALDYDSAAAALSLASQLDPSKCRLKVGKELFTIAGPELVEQLQRLGFEIFLDLKYHDIPNTCAQAVKAAADLGVWMVNVHASGGRAMMEASANILQQFSGHKPYLIGVTALTSLETSDLMEVGFNSAAEQLVERLAWLAKECGLDGIVCSSREVRRLREMLGEDFLFVTPGIRPASSDAGDQKRVMTPVQAVREGSDYLVIGRPITKSPDPLAALENIVKEITV